MSVLDNVSHEELIEIARFVKTAGDRKISEIPTLLSTGELDGLLVVLGVSETDIDEYKKYATILSIFA